MKLWKKILIAVVILGVIGIGFAGYGLYKMGTAYKEKIEPDMKQYVQMTKEEQDKYVITHMEDLLVAIQSGNDKDLQSDLDAVRNNPEVRQAGIDWGRSICASLIDMSDDISEGLSEEAKALYKAEAEAGEKRSDKFTKLLKEHRK
ncbi:MAG: hypothetical protein IKR65_01790 [Selenomonadaceae bacterium]|nr:hypothetical protein [Selenomonadaceae bacterium]MBR6342625.1 hypothetical protein [Selenomonadaceae bacterium]